MHLRRVGVAGPPQVQPVGINLVVRNQDQPLREEKLDAPVFGLANLVRDRDVSRHADNGRPPPFRYRHGEEGEGLFCVGHVGVVHVAVIPVEGRADELRY